MSKYCLINKIFFEAIDDVDARIQARQIQFSIDSKIISSDFIIKEDEHKVSLQKIEVDSPPKGIKF